MHHGDHSGHHGGSGAHASGHNHHDHHARIFLQKFWLSAALTIPVVLWSELPERFLGFSLPGFSVGGFTEMHLAAVLAAAVFFYGGSVFLAGAWSELRMRLPGMMTLVALAISAAFVYSVATLFIGGGMPIFWELSTLVVIMLLGHWLEMKSTGRASQSLGALAELLPDTAEVLRGEQTFTVPLRELAEGDIVAIRPGTRMPADGVVIEGTSTANEAMVTGESRPVEKRPLSNIIAGTTNGDGFLMVRVTKIGEHTFLAGIMRLVADAQKSRSRLETLANAAARWLTVIAIVAGSATFVVWLVMDAPFSFAVERLIAVLVIACPHALGVAIPLVASISVGRAARLGILIRDRIMFEAARGVTAVLFDKTGTLTSGDYGVIAVIANSAARVTDGAVPDESFVLECAASLESRSEHPVARAIVGEARRRNLPLRTVNDFERAPGRGVWGVVAGKEVALGGSVEIMESYGVSVPLELRAAAGEYLDQGMTVVYVAEARVALGAIALGDAIRPEAAEAVAGLAKMGVSVMMITGDSKEVAALVAKRVGITEFFAGVKPEEKVWKVRELQKRGLVVAMVGDGINDAPALAASDVGIAMGAGTNVAIESAGVIVVKNDPRDAERIIRLSRATYGKMIQNLFWATAYNVATMPLAAGVLASRDIFVSPATGAIFMTVSTVIVALNAMLLLRLKL